MGLEPQLIDIKPLKDTKHDDITIIDDTISGLELHSGEAKHHVDNDEQLGVTSSSPSSSNSSPSSSSCDFKKLDFGKDDTTQWSMMSATPRAGSSANSSSELLPPNHPDWSKMLSNISSAPRMQTMNRPPAGYDPTRIPSHVFSSKASTPMEWSAASNDSLFSIHMGISSFPRDHIFKVGGLGGGGDTKPEECSNIIPISNNVSEGGKCNDSSSNSFSSNLSPVSETSSDNDKKFTHDEEDSKVLKESITQTLQEKHKENQDPGTQEVVSLSANSSPSNSLGGKGSPAPRASHDSATSTTSTGSFAFPLLVEVGKNASLKAIEEEKHDEVQPLDQLPQNQTPKAAAPATGTSWLSYLPNWLRCC